MRNRVLFALLSFGIMLFLSGCAKQPEIYDYSSFLESKPRSILVLMPTNESLNIKGSSAVLANAIYPLSEAGYYVFSPALVNDTFRHNGVFEADEIHKIPLHKLKQIYNADAALYINVKQYGTGYALLKSVTTVNVHAKLVDMNSGRLLWEKEAVASDESGNGGGNIIGMMISAMVSQIASSITDKAFDVSMIADNILLHTGCHDCILSGPYSPNHGKDAQLQGSK